MLNVLIGREQVLGFVLFDCLADDDNDVDDDDDEHHGVGVNVT